jgi:hypothetical protein
LKSSKNDTREEKNVGLKKRFFEKTYFHDFFFLAPTFFYLSYHFLSFLKAFRKCNKNENLLNQSSVIGLKKPLLLYSLFLD